MKTQASYLSAPEQERIHQDSLRILAEVGVRFHSARARKLLAGQGARVDHGREVGMDRPGAGRASPESRTGSPSPPTKSAPTAPFYFTMTARRAGPAGFIAW